MFYITYCSSNRKPKEQKIKQNKKQRLHLSKSVGKKKPKISGM
jgi:hypothetical protein